MNKVAREHVQSVKKAGSTSEDRVRKKLTRSPTYFPFVSMLFKNTYLRNDVFFLLPQKPLSK